MPLTDKRVRDAKPTDRTTILWDDLVRGLGLRVTPGGVRSFVINYRADGVERRMTLGRATELSLAEAREMAAEAKKSVRAGSDPLQTSRSRRELPTVSEAFDRFSEEYIPRRIALGRMAERTAKEYRRQIERDLRPRLGRKRVRDISQNDVEKALGHLAPVSANRVRALASKVFRLFEDWGWREQNSNPARGIEKASEEPRDRTLSGDELAALGSALSTIDANESAILAIRLAALTGLRIGEISAMRWSEIDIAGGYVTLPKTKTGRRIHTLPQAALALLADAKKAGPFVVAGSDPTKPLNGRTIGRVFERSCTLAAIESATIHDLRRTIMTQAAATGVSAHLLRDMVGHKTTAMADRYIRRAGEPLTELRERIGETMAAQMGPKDAKAPKREGSIHE